ncbi:MAG: membrane protein insertion efficiency factor YidD [bacterium]
MPAYPQKMILKFIRLYQKTISPDHSWLSIFFPDGYCRFQPTCSEYSYQAVNKYGVLKGGLLAIKRIIRCNPFNKGGADPLH